jgi:hypothetical protein
MPTGALSVISGVCMMVCKNKRMIYFINTGGTAEAYRLLSLQGDEGFFYYKKPTATESLTAF